VQHRKDHVDFRVRARFGEDGLRLPPALFVDKVLDYLVLSRVHVLHDGFRRIDGHLVLAAAAAVKDGYS
jgi:hypothetical protein